MMANADLYGPPPYLWVPYEPQLRTRPPGAAYPACASLQRLLSYPLVSIHSFDLTQS